MKKLIFAIWVLFSFPTISLAQETTAVWQFYKGDSDEFFAEFPSVTKSSKITDFNTKKEYGNLYKSFFNKTFYFVVACKTTDCPQFEIVKKLKFQARNTANSQFSERSVDDSTIESSFTDSEGFFQKIRQIRTEKFYFIVHTVSETLNNPETERFFKSFQLKPTADETQKAEKEKYDKFLASDDPNNVSASIPKTLANLQSNLNSNSAKKEESQYVPLSILTKPPAKYTDAARFYEISGKVLLRVTFLANKSISTITPLKKLPFGLTEQANAAVTGLSFNPAMRDGKPISINKQVEYIFTIF